MVPVPMDNYATLEVPGVCPVLRVAACIALPASLCKGGGVVGPAVLVCGVVRRSTFIPHGISMLIFLPIPVGPLGKQ